MRKTYANIQALRFVAAMMVVLVHVTPRYSHRDGLFPTGFIEATFFAGVDIFFVISGFIIWVTASHKAGTHEAFRFALRRAWRIYSAYLPALGFAALVYWYVAPGRLDLASAWSSITLAPTHEPHARLLGISWTLTFELYFYALFAIMIAFRRLLPWLLVAVCALAVLHMATRLNGTGIVIGAWGNMAFHLLLLEFAAGCLVGWLVTRTPARHGVVALAFGLSMFVAGALIYWYFGAKGEGLISIVARVVCFGLPSAFIVYGLALVDDHYVPGWLMELGNASYALYLLHVPILIAVFLTLPDQIPSLSALLAIGLSIGASVIYYRCWEYPVRRWPDTIRLSPREA